MDDLRKITKIVRNMNLYKNKTGKNELTDNEYEAARYLTKKPGISQKELSEYLNVDKGLVSRIITKLEKQDLVKIISNPNDLRSKQLFPTEKSHNLKESTNKEELEFYIHVAKVLDDEEKEQFLELLDRLYQESKRLRKNKFEEI